MTKHEAAVISAFTGLLIGGFDELHKYIEQIMGRPVFTHELGSAQVANQIKELSRPDFIKLNASITD